MSAKKKGNSLKDDHSYDNLLSSLLDLGGVHSAHSHDDIISACSAPDISSLTKEAEKIAQRSAQLLHESSVFCHHPSTRFDSLFSHASTEAKDESVPFRLIQPSSDCSSSSFTILENLKKKSETINENNMNLSVHPLSKKIYEYFLSHGGRAKTEELLDYFKGHVEDEKMIIFRSLLRKIAYLKASDEGEKIWKIKNKK